MHRGGWRIPALRVLRRAAGASLCIGAGVGFANGAVSGAIQGAMAGPSERAKHKDFHYSDDHPVGNFARTKDVRQAYVELMVERSDLGNPNDYQYVDAPRDIPEGVWMDTSRKGKVSIYPAAFEDLNFYHFGSALYHERVHALRFSGYRSTGYVVRPPSRSFGGDQASFMMEAEAYSKMLANQNPFRRGISSAFQAGIQRHNAEYGYGALTAQNAAFANGGQFNCQQLGC